MDSYRIVNEIVKVQNSFQKDSETAKVLADLVKTIRKVGSDPEDPIDNKMHGDLFPLLAEAKWSLGDLKDLIRIEYGLHSTKAIPYKLYDVICHQLIEKAAPPSKGNL